MCECVEPRDDWLQVSSAPLPPPPSAHSPDPVSAVGAGVTEVRPPPDPALVTALLRSQEKCLLRDL